MTTVQLSLVALLALASPVAEAQAWRPTGPTGGDVRALARHPLEAGGLYLGTAHGVLYRSDDAGHRWRRLEPGFPLAGMSLDSIVVTAQGTVFVGYWQVAGIGGGVARSTDAGRTFEVLPGVAGESVRALAVAPADSSRLVAGTLSGVFASHDGGTSWRRISPPGHPEIRNVESIAIDARDPDTVYAGTWHLPWKTLDGGRRWQPISAGMIDDSDVFTLTLDARDPRTLYATACTGIYRSKNAGALWAKLRGIPSSSRRTRAFAQDPDRPDTLYAGTTEGLWVSEDSGASWSQRTPKEVVVNAVAALAGGELLLGTDGAGVLRSGDRGRSFAASNDGFSALLLTELVRDREGRGWIAAVRNDRFHSGVLAAPRLDGPWTKLAPGLEGRELTALLSLERELYAGTDAGVFVLRAGASEWRRTRLLVAGIEQQPRVAELLGVGPGIVFAATDRGLLRSADRGVAWRRVPLGTARAAIALARLGDAVLAATPLGIFRSDDLGESFRPLSSGPDAVLQRLLAVPGDERTLFAATTSGLYKSVDGGKGFYRCYGGLPITEIAGLALHPDGRTLFAADFVRGGLFRSEDLGESWRSVATEGLRPDRVWGVMFDPERPEALLAATASGGLHALDRAQAGSAAGSANPNHD